MIRFTSLSLKKGFFLVAAFFLSGNAQTPAFPSAEGFGRFTTGGRGGEVYHVTNLNDAGAGSFRDAVSKSNRIVVFDVGGVINIGDRIVIQKNIYVAGQTAPGGGITIYGNGMALNSSSGNSIVRYLRIRMGDQGDSRKDALGISDGQNYIFDNVSISWGHDGTLDVNGTNIDNITFQDCIISQGIDIVGHSTGGLFQSGKWSMIRSLYIDNETRNPKGKGTHEFINNVIYNWGSDGYIMGATTGLSEVNMIGNYFIAGPSSSIGSHITRTTPEFHVYAADNWLDDNRDGVLNAQKMTSYKTATVMNSPFDYDGTKYAKSAGEALANLIKTVGGTPRDAVDEYLINELLSYGKKGKIIVRESENGIPGNVGTVANGTPPKDTDKDGMPDAWESLHGLNPNSADDKGKNLSDEGYTNVEMYLNELAGDKVVYKDPTSTSSTTEPSSSVEVSSSSAETLTCGQGECQSVLQAEEFCNADGVSEASNSGFSGSGYVNLDNAVNTKVSYMVTSPKALQTDMLVVYANGGSSARNMSLLVNDVAVTNEVAFPATNSWTDWKSASIAVNLHAGANKVEFTSLTADGAPNLDAFGFAEDGISYANCTTNLIQSIKSENTQGLAAYIRSGQLFLNSMPQGQFELILRNVSGEKVLNITANGDDQLDITSLKKGVYFAEVIQGQTVVSSFKILYLNN